MKETAWRTKLIKQFRSRNEKGFIWAHDAKFKAGFPDLYTVVTGIGCHYELKVGQSKYHVGDKFGECIKRAFEPIQIAISNEIAAAAGKARGLILLPTKEVVLVNFNESTLKVYQDYEFEFEWMTRKFL